MRRWPALGLALAAMAGLAAGCSHAARPAATEPSLPDRITVTSPAFADGAAIPARFTCGAEDRSPPLAWSGVPAGSAEVALVVDDPDAPGGGFVHWVVFHLAPATGGLGENALPGGARQATGSSGKAAWTGPCPPPGPAHHYRFTVYALARPLDLPDGAKGGSAIAQIQRAASASGRLTATFGR